MEDKKRKCNCWLEIDTCYCEEDKEVWKDIPNYDGHYQVSNLGNVRSLKRGKVRLLKPINHSTGYSVVNLYLNKKMKGFYVHKLIAITFLNHKPDGFRLVVDHINNIKTDNRLSNLQIITNRENSSKDRKGGSSRYTGVLWSKQKNRWQSRIQIDGKSKHIGYFVDEYQAHLAYQEELKRLTKDVE